MLSQMKRVKKLLPDHSATHWYPSEQVRKKSASLFFRRQPDEFGWSKSRQREEQTVCDTFPTKYDHHSLVPILTLEKATCSHIPIVLGQFILGNNEEFY